MLPLIKKEITSFFSHPSGTIIILFFLFANGGLMWLYPSDLNILDSGFAQMDGLFTLSPFLFVVFIPALCMRLFSDDYKDGTIEILKTLPISTQKMVLAKYLSAVAIVFFAMVPSIIYVVSIFFLSDPLGNIDIAGTISSYLGLILLSAMFVSIGLFASSTTSNQIVSLLIAILICAMFYFGFDLLARGFSHGFVQLFIENIGADYHYRSLSKGVIDSRDIIYFVSLIVIFLQSTIFVIREK